VKKRIQPNRRNRGKATKPMKPAPSNSYSAQQSRHWRRQQAGEQCPKSCTICKRLAKRGREQAAEQAPRQARLPVPVHARVHAPVHADPPAQAQRESMQAFLAQLRDVQVVAPPARLAAAQVSAAHGHHPAVLVPLLLLCTGAAVAGFVMAWDSLTGTYHGVSAPARALAVFAAELVFGHFAFMAYRARGWLAGLPCGVVVVLCAFVDIGIAGMQGAVAERQAKDAIDAAPAVTFQPSTKCEPKDAPKEYGTERLPIWQAGEAKRMADCRAQQDKERQEFDTQQATTKASRIQRAGERSFFERIMPGLMPLLGALAAAAVMPLLEMLVEAVRRRPAARKAARAGAP
jgi:hypothetical protein